MRYANVASTFALVIAVGGTSYAATSLAPHSVGTKQLKDGAVTSAKVRNFSLTYKDFQGGQLGLVLGYAHIKRDGTVDANNSFGVTTSNVQMAGNSAGWCFSGLDFAIHGAVATVDSPNLNSVSPAFTLGDPAGDCFGTGEGEVISSDTQGPTGVFVVFY